LVGVGVRPVWGFSGAMMVAVAGMSSVEMDWGWYRLVCAVLVE